MAGNSTSGTNIDPSLICHRKWQCVLADNNAFTFQASRPFFTSAGDLWLQHGRAGTMVCGDLNGDGVAEIQIYLDGADGLTASDFIL
jgi:hypothetical protein